MTTKVSSRPARIATLVVTLALVTMAGAASAMTVEEYAALTLSRLELAHASWSENSEPPSAEEETALFEAAGTDSETYYGFAAKNREAIESYLEENPDVAAEIDSLSAAIVALIEQTEVE